MDEVWDNYFENNAPDPLAVLGLLAWRGERFGLRSGIRCILGMAAV